MDRMYYVLSYTLCTGTLQLLCIQDVHLPAPFLCVGNEQPHPRSISLPGESAFTAASATPLLPRHSTASTSPCGFHRSIGLSVAMLEDASGNRHNVVVVKRVNPSSVAHKVRKRPDFPSFWRVCVRACWAQCAL